MSVGKNELSTSAGERASTAPAAGPLDRLVAARPALLAATELAWRDGWFHTGDTVWRGADGMLHFVDRKKNIIRRSAENIAAALHPGVAADSQLAAVKEALRLLEARKPD